MPELLAISANSPFLDGATPGSIRGADADLHEELSALQDPGRVRRLATHAAYIDFLGRTHSITEFTQVWWSMRPAPLVGIGRDADLRRADERRRLDRAAALITSCVAQAALDHDEGVPFDDPPARYVEENFWRAIRYGLDGKLIDLTRAEEYPAAAARDRLLAWTTPARMALGIDIRSRRRTGRSARSASSPKARLLRTSMPRRWRSRSAPTRPRRWRPETEPQPTEEQLLEALRQIKTEDVVVQTVATLVNLAGQKLSVEGAKDPAEAQKAIDAARHMLPLVPDEASRRSRTRSIRSR